jgi:uncharacterized protein (TIGR03435 family)
MPVMKWLALIIGVLALAIVAIVACIRLQPAPSREWKEFAIGPAAGISLSINPYSGIRGDGASLLPLLAWVNGLPRVRVIGPESLQTRFAIVAAVYDENPDTLRSLLRRELESRFRLETHKETRPFDVWVLTATARPALEPVTNGRPSSRIQGRSMKLTGPIGNLTGDLQLVLGRPVVDETGLRGDYTMEFTWSKDRDESVAAALYDKFGLLLTPGQRNLDALVVDRIRPDMAMAIFSGIDRLTKFAPPGLRHSVSRALTIQ